MGKRKNIAIYSKVVWVFLIFVDWIDGHAGRGSRYSNNSDWIRSRKVLSDFLKNVGGG